MATKVTMPVKAGVLIPSDWKQQIEDGLTVSEIETPAIDYIEFKRDSILEGGKNIFITTNKGKSWTKANGLFCKEMAKSRAEALKTMSKILAEEKKRLINEIESRSVKLKKISK